MNTKSDTEKRWRRANFFSTQIATPVVPDKVNLALVLFPHDTLKQLPSAFGSLIPSWIGRVTSVPQISGGIKWS